MWNLKMGYPYRFYKNMAISHKNLKLEIVKFLKKSIVFKDRPPTLFHTWRLSNSGVSKSVKTWGADARPSLQKNGAYSRDQKSW
jgi:hypothetical protein